MRAAFACILSIGTLASPVAAKTLRVPQQFATIWAAVDASESGDVIKVAAGDYTDGATLSARHRLTIRGAGPGRSTITASKSLIFFRVFAIFDSSHVTISGFTITGDSDAVLEAFNSRDVTVRDCEVRDDGADSPGGMTFSNCDGVRLSRLTMRGARARVRVGFDTTPIFGATEVDHCRFEDVQDVALTFVADQVSVHDCSFARIQDSAVVVADAPLPGDADIVKNEFDDIGMSAVSIASNHSIRITANHVNQTGAVGLYAKTTIDATFRKNRVSDAAVGGIGVEFAGAVVEQNRIEDAPQIGIIVLGADALVARNRIERCGTAGISLFEAGSTVRKNVVVDSSGDGIFTSSSATGAKIDSNRVAKPAGNGLLIAASAIDLRKNRVTDATLHGFEVTSAGNTLIKNSAHGSALSDLHCDLQANTIAGNNDFGTVEDIP